MVCLSMITTFNLADPEQQLYGLMPAPKDTSTHYT